jgi:hypothetical protein
MYLVGNGEYMCLVGNMEFLLKWNWHLLYHK